jgi:uncharacterized protein (TIGR02118 family)
MVKLVFCLHRRPDLGLEEFQRYWRDEHAPLVRRHAPALGILRYVQTHTRPSPEADAVRASRGGPEPYDGVAELWFGDRAALVGAASSAEGQAASAALLEDERRFIDLGRSPIFLAEEDEIIAATDGDGDRLDTGVAWDEP